MRKILALVVIAVLTLAGIAYTVFFQKPKLAVVYFEQGVVLVPADKLNKARAAETVSNRIVAIADDPSKARVDVLYARKNTDVPRTVTLDYSQLEANYYACETDQRREALKIVAADPALLLDPVVWGELKERFQLETEFCRLLYSSMANPDMRDVTRVAPQAEGAYALHSTLQGAPLTKFAQGIQEFAP